MADRIKVAVRIRPLLQQEISRGEKVLWSTDNEKHIFQIDETRQPLNEHNFAFDRVYGPEASTCILFNEICRSVIVSTITGVNGSIFTYGQTSSGKTHTMMSEDGVINLAVHNVFEEIEKDHLRIFTLRVSYMEIYNERISDLLVKHSKPTGLKVNQDVNGQVYVSNLSEKVVTGPQEAIDWLKFGNENRHIGETAMNEKSSRSHAIFRMIIEGSDKSSETTTIAHLNFIDLAGSERVNLSKQRDERFREGVNINQSLLSLSTAINRLSMGLKPSYRSSVLTRILQNSLSGCAKTIIICNVTPSAEAQTISTLNFAASAKTIAIKPVVNKVESKASLLKKIQEHASDLEKKNAQLAQELVECENAEKRSRLRENLALKMMLDAQQLKSSLVMKERLEIRRQTWGGKALSSFMSKDPIGIQKDRLFFRSDHEDCFISPTEMNFFSVESQEMNDMQEYFLTGSACKSQPLPPTSVYIQTDSDVDADILTSKLQDSNLRYQILNQHLEESEMKYNKLQAEFHLKEQELLSINDMLKGDIVMLEADLISLKRENDQLLRPQNAAEAIVTELTNKVAGLESSNSCISKALKDANDEIDNMKASLNTISASAQSLKTEESESMVTKESYINLQEEFEESQRDLELVITQFKTYEEHSYKLEATCSQLKDRIGDLEESQSTLKKNNLILETNLVDVKEQNRKLKEENNQHYSDIQYLQKKNTQLKNDLRKTKESVHDESIFPSLSKVPAVETKQDLGFISNLQLQQLNLQNESLKQKLNEALQKLQTLESATSVQQSSLCSPVQPPKPLCQSPDKENRVSSSQALSTPVKDYWIMPDGFCDTPPNPVKRVPHDADCKTQ